VKLTSPSSDKVKNSWSYNCIPLYVFMVRVKVKVKVKVKINLYGCITKYISTHYWARH